MTDALRCPVCAQPLTRTDPTLRCPNNHSFDLNKHGYVTLGTGRKLPEGDTPAMVAARTAFLSAAHYLPLATTLTNLVDHELMARVDGVSRPQLHDQRGGTVPLVVDLGAGTGYYLAAVLDGWTQAQGLAFDVSKAALRRAAKAHPRAGAVLADTWGTLPLADDSVDLLLNVFAPRNGTQMRRVLKPGGLLVVVTPTERHLAELRERLGLLSVDPSKAERLAHELRDFTQTGEQLLEWDLHLTATQADDLIAMGPNAFHSQSRATAPVTCTASVRIGTYRPR
ncbi:putative RNA methyltransferase [Catellatospora vulcania]|uniref:putative RNA methyltransferase n=1 Tax=Catellatospora vulcania TaxID=1460450 RepID=UPI0012D3B4AF|nr:methyltransferase domain-containing protein [Catellatospora vulcania]